MAEGAQQVLNCQASKICNELGACEATQATTKFTLSPLKVGPKGEGSFLIEYNDISTTVQNVTDSGPFVWSEGDSDIQSLLPAGDKSVLWHRLRAGIPPTSTITFLICEDAG